MESGTITAAADHLHVSQPAVSQMLKEFEVILGVKLFDRVKGRLIPTTEATLFLGEVNRVYKGMEYLKDYAELLSLSRTQKFEIGVYPGIFGKLFSSILSSFVQARKELTVTVHDLTSIQILEYTRAQQIDLGISTLATEDPSITCTLLTEIAPCCIVPLGHPYAKKKLIKIEELQGQDFISLSNIDNTRSRIQKVFKDMAIEVNTVMQVGLSASACYLVAQGLGISIVDRLSAQEHSHLPLAPIPLDVDISFPTYLIRPSSGRTSALAASFMDHLVQQFRE